MGKKVSIIQASDNLKEDIIKAVNGIGGFTRFIKTKDRVLLKPNFNTADPFPASTDFEFLKTVVELVYQLGAKQVIIGDRPTICQINPHGRPTLEKLGIFKLEKIGPATRVLVFDEQRFVKKEIPKGKYLKSVFIPEILDRIDKLILLPCLKTHVSAQFTGSLKLSVGYMKPASRIALHLSRLQEKIAELNTIIHPNLIIMDARRCFISKGPNFGEIRKPGIIMASTSRIAIDVEGIKIIQGFDRNSLTGIDPLELPQIKHALQIGVD